MIPDHKERIPVTLDKALVIELDRLAGDHGKHRSTIISAILHDWLKERPSAGHREGAIRPALRDEWRRKHGQTHNI
ncbi:MAG: hypothetical protein OXQ29_03550 [Rhodospirillaceae bacterium]|nr:hypothetical protein [Rhodospirillaceae bacterium]